MENVVTLVLGGGQGTRLYPLTKYRSKPAVPVAGKYRLIDIPLSNCINSGLNRVYVLTQFNSTSLHRHIRSTYIFDSFSRGFVEILAAQQTLDNANWYQGTADAVRQNLRHIEQPEVRYILVLSGDQLYRMNYQHLIEAHRRSGADVTIAAVPVAAEAASSMGIMRLDDSGRVVGFLEKPQTKEDLDLVRTDPAWLDAHGIASRGRDCLANMGIYLFNRATLLEALEKTDYRDFGKEVFPASMRTHRVQVYLFDDYWEDIGTIRSFYEANLELTSAAPRFDLSVADAPIYSRARSLPPFVDRPGHDPPQPGGRRLPDRRGRGDREQHRGAALPDRPQRDHPQLDPDGQRLLRGPGRDCGGQEQRPAPAGRRLRHAHRRGDHRQELPHRPRGADRQRRRRWTSPRRRRTG